MPYMPCKNPDCNGYRKAEENYCPRCLAFYSKYFEQEVSITDLIKDKEVKPLGELEEYNIYED